MNSTLGLYSTNTLKFGEQTNCVNFEYENSLPKALPLFDISEITTKGSTNYSKSNSGYVKTKSKAKVVIYKKTGNDIKYLFGKEAYGKSKRLMYNLLGGTCNYNETVVNCAARELYEETVGIIPIRDTLSAIYNEPTENVIKYNMNINGNTVSVYVFFINATQFDKCCIERLEREFDRRRELIKEILYEGKFEDNERRRLKRELKLKRPIERISKSYIKHFYEIYKLEWISSYELCKHYQFTNFVRRIYFIQYKFGDSIYIENLTNFLVNKKKENGKKTEWTLV